ncbi:hypothetical protein BH10BAC4_BH10BAC4_03140 [soil metagenome]
MKNFIFILLPVLLQACTTATAPESASDQTLKVEKGLIGEVYFTGDSTRAIEERMKHFGVPGVSIAVIKDNKIEWSKSYGVMNKDTKEPVTNQTLFQAGSISKPVAAYGALHLVDKGKINLDEDVNTYLKSWKLPDNDFTKEKKVTLKHLLSHTGGLTVHGFLGYSPDLPVPTLVQVLDGTAPANSGPIRVDKVPEESFRYSGGGYTIMQQMLIDTEGKPFPQIMKEFVLDPIGMSHSTYDQPLTGNQVSIAATGYVPDGTMTKGKFHTYPEMAAAGLWTTAEDLALFAIDVQKTVAGKSTAVLSKSMVDRMRTPFVTDFEGLGLFLRNKGSYFGHGGWDEGFSSEMIAHRDHGYGVVVLTNSNHPEFITEVINSVARVYNWSDYLDIFTKVEMDTTKFAAITGRYHNDSDGMIRISGKGNRLFMKYLRAEAPYELFRVSDSTFVNATNPKQIQFRTNPKDGQLNLVFIEKGKPAEFTHVRESEDLRVPYEYLLAGDFDKAIKGYQALLNANPKDRDVMEESLNSQGYNLMNKSKYQLAADILKINTLLYPSSANAYDSYAEACMKNGNKELAIINYKKSLLLNPKNEGAKKNLKELSSK